ncbi:hypothetical protein MGG_17177 [Pyricularia oryzae 70-15]|uniref:Uncharacterized protein n=1 Tax=Pyricularia oryzae (strain 70-15 / ATCC MYA-4617 / FGSC 8958) TaxID=242507 RepID=G4N6V7_PYRO7|nr:uncharacterized protein MGG_17177 [Pyricularia oryzae 70-15]EHA50721.1 hypothetical protein MGG_17177 [Pyricularia oryzae 70-15]
MGSVSLKTEGGGGGGMSRFWQGLIVVRTAQADAGDTVQVQVHVHVQVPGRVQGGA